MPIIAQQSNMINTLILTNNKPHLKHNLETTGKSGRLENKCAKKHSSQCFITKERMAISKTTINSIIAMHYLASTLSLLHRNQIHDQNALYR